MKDLSNTRRNRSPRIARALLEAGAFTLALAVTVSSAIVAKERTAPALVAMDTTRAPAPTLAAVDTIRPTSRVKSASAAPATQRATEAGHTDPNVRYFNGRAVRPVRTIEMVVTAYSPDERSCGKWADGITASNKSVWTNGMQLVAADTRLLPFGSLLSIPGYADDEIVPVLDRGGAIKGKRLDVLYPTHEIALQWGVQRLPVVVWEYVD
ncbi:MAG: hypothetical protein EA379_03790 [Phycisphaerales bacterium]|nr:MAG: hypothetical protein EA379_03790 [Phycisphaerales bacterium]